MTKDINTNDTIGSVIVMTSLIVFNGKGTTQMLKEVPRFCIKT